VAVVALVVVVAQVATVQVLAAKTLAVVQVQSLR
jgi:hypothetical protein